MAPVALDEEVVGDLFSHYLELRRWSPRVALIGPGTAREVLERHYGESLAALPLLPPVGVALGPLVDLGSGAGFPGFVLAAVRRDLEVWLVEPRGRKWAFLEAAARRAALPIRCLDARVSLPLPRELPARIACVTARALRLRAPVLAALAGRLGEEGRLLLWAGEDDPELPAGLGVRRSVRLAGSESRRILDLRPAAGTRTGGPGTR